MPQETPDTPDEQNTAPAGDEQTTEQQQPASDEQPASEQSDDGKTFDADYVKQLRDEAAKHRNEKSQTKKERDELKGTIEKLRKALDPEADEDEDPAKVAERAQAERDKAAQELRELRVERAADKAARTHGADVTALTDSRAFNKAAEDLDPTADDFDEQMSKLVEKAVTDNPKLKAGQAPARSSSAITGGTGGKPTFTSSQIASMSKKEYAQREDEILEALADGRVQ